MLLGRMGTSWKREVLNLYEVVQGPPDRVGSMCSTYVTGTAVAACRELGMPDRWWENPSLFIVQPNDTTEFIYAKDNGAWADFLISTLGMSEEEKLWFNTSVLLSCVEG